MSVLIDTLYVLLAFLYVPAFIFKGKHRPGISQRWAVYPAEVLSIIRDRKPLFWVHAVSVGEVKAAAPVISLLRQKHPQARILISTVTPTGNAVAAKIAEKDDIVIYFPFDLSFLVKKALNIFNPAILVIMETELWPNFIFEAAKRNIPVALVNGRISEKAFPSYRLAGFIFKKVLEKISLICMQTEEDAGKIISLGADKDIVHVCGNVKFDQVSSVADDAVKEIGIGSGLGERLIIAGSTHEGEEEMLARVFIRLKVSFPDVSLLIAPRHLHRVKDIVNMMKKYGLLCVVIRSLKEKPLITKDSVFILDIMGILHQIYQLADVVYVGGSLVPHGGQNPIEPAIWGKPVVFGRYMHNFAGIADVFIKNKAALSVNSEQELYNALKNLLQNEGLRQELSRNAGMLIAANKGSALRIIELLEDKISVGKG